MFTSRFLLILLLSVSASWAKVTCWQDRNIQDAQYAGEIYGQRLGNKGTLSVPTGEEGLQEIALFCGKVKASDTVEKMTCTSFDSAYSVAFEVQKKDGDATVKVTAPIWSRPRTLNDCEQEGFPPFGIKTDIKL